MRARILHLIAIAFVLAACDKKPAAPATTAPGDDPAAGVSESIPGPGPSSDSGDDPEAPTAPTAPTADDPGEDEGGEPETAARSPGDPVSVPEDPAEGLSEPTSFADVKLEIKLGGGKVHRDEGKVIRWEELTRIPIDIDGQKHEFIVYVTRAGQNAEVRMSYNRNGNEVLRKYTFDAAIKKRKVLRIDDGSALALTITPKTIKPHPSTHQKVEKVEGNDPLDGAKKGK